MITKKNQIISMLSMEMVLNKYGIKIERNKMFHCPFHGEDRHASAKAYKTSYYCFACNSTHDLIGFVQNYFNLSFKEAMNKLIEDFSLPIEKNGKYDKQKILEFQRKKQIELEIKENKRKRFIDLCKRKDLYNSLIEKWKKQITTANWENMTVAISWLQDRVELLDIYISQEYNLDY